MDFRIVKIINDSTVVINAGSDDKVKKGDKFEIYETGEEVIDPKTGENLGTLDTIKETLNIVRIYPKMCICRKIVDISTLTGMKSRYKSLNVDTKDISGGITDENYVIKVGDKVRIIKN